MVHDILGGIELESRDVLHKWTSPAAKDVVYLFQMARDGVRLHRILALCADNDLVGFEIKEEF